MTRSRRASKTPRAHPRAKKKFGQHFLVNPGQIERILNLMEAAPGEPVLEIGPGPGTLTLPLLNRGVALEVVEADGDMVAHLENLKPEHAFGITQGDFLDIELDRFFQTQTRVVSNLPYNVSVPITARLLRHTPQIPKMVLMYQKEVAERIAAAPKSRDYGQISVVSQCYYRIKRGFDLAPGAFSPPPKVWSRVLVFNRRDDPQLPLDLLPKLEQLLHVLFSHRRKMIGGILKKWSPVWTDGPALLESYLSCEFDPTWRPEVLAPDDYACWIRAFHGI